MNRKLLYLLAFAAIAVIVAYRWRGSGFDWSLFLSTMWSLHPGWLAASVLATLLTYLFRATRWQVLLRPLKAVRFETLLTTTLVGFSAIYCLGRAGELVRPVWLTRREQIPLSGAVATIIVERFLDTLMIVLMFSASLLFVEVASSAAGPLEILRKTAWILLAGSVGGIVLMFALRSNIERIVRYVPVARIASLLRSFAEGLASLGGAKTLSIVLAHSAVLWLLIALQFWFMLLGMNFHYSLQASTLIMVIAAVGSIAQLPGFGGGFQAGFALALTTFFDVPAERAIAASLVAWVFSYMPTVLITGAYMLVQGMSFSDLRVSAETK